MLQTGLFIKTEKRKNTMKKDLHLTNSERPVPCEIASKIYNEHVKKCKVCQAYYAWFTNEMIENIENIDKD